VLAVAVHERLLCVMQRVSASYAAHLCTRRGAHDVSYGVVLCTVMYPCSYTASANKPRVGEFYDPQGMISTLRDNQDMMQVHTILYTTPQFMCRNYSSTIRSLSEITVTVLTVIALLSHTMLGHTIRSYTDQEDLCYAIQ
jgi:hypothetical protein